MTSSCQSYSCTAPTKMARHVQVILTTALVSLALPHPDAPLYPNNVVFASAPLLQQPAQPSPQFITRTFNNGAFTLQNAASPNPALFVAAQPNQINTAIPQTQSAAAAPQRAVSQIIPEGAPTQSVPHNFVTFTRTPSLQLVQSPAEPQQSVPRNFVAFTRVPAQQVVQSPAEPAQSIPRNFVTFTRVPPQQYLGSQTAVAPSQANGQPQNLAQQQFGLRNVFVPASTQESDSAPNTVPAQRPGVRTVILFPPQQSSAQSNLQSDQKPKTVAPLFAPPPPKQRTVLVARPAQAAEQSQLSSNTQMQPLVVSSSQFFTRNFGNSGAVTYFIQPLSTARAGQAAPSNHESPDAET